MTVFLRGDRLDRRVTARDANRMLRAAQEYDAGLGNLTTQQVIDTFQAGHILVRNDTQWTVYPYTVMGYAQADARFDTRNANISTRLNVFTGQRLKVYKHWFRHCVFQQGAAPGEVVPAAINGLSFCSVRDPANTTTTLAMGSMVAIEDADTFSTEWFYSGFRHLGSTTAGRYGHAHLVQAGNLGVTFRYALVNLQKITPCWRVSLTNRVSNVEFDGVIADYSGIIGSSGNMKVYDPQGICPDTTIIPTGACDVKGFAEIYQPSINTTNKTEIPDIAGVLISVNATTVRDGLQEETILPP